MSPRATPLPPEERRANLIAATSPLLLQHGFNVSTAQIAEAAGVAEGTIFRVFDSKQDLLDATVCSVLDAQPLVAAIENIETTLPLEQRLRELVELLQQRTAAVSNLMFALHAAEPTRQQRHHEQHHSGHLRQEQAERVTAAVVDLLGPDADQIGFPLPQAASMLRSVAVVSVHPLLGDGALSDPDQIVQMFLHGVLKEPSC